MFTFSSSGESHGRGVVAMISEVPAGFLIDLDKINKELARRQRGYGRGARMSIEKDRVKVISGIRGGVTLGSPIVFLIENRDWENWVPYMDPETKSLPGREITRPRPGHADLAGGLKYGHKDLRNVLERASARETVARTAAGGLAKIILNTFGLKFYGYTISIGEIEIEATDLSLEERRLSAEDSPFATPVPDRDDEIKLIVDRAKEEGNTLGGVVEVVVTGVPPGLGSNSQWYTRIDARLAGALMSIPAIKGIEIGEGFGLAKRLGSQAHDEIFYDKKRGFYRKTNRAGGIEGGITNGSDIVIRAAMKPIPTLMMPLSSVDISSKETKKAQPERSDVMAVPSASVVAESMTAIVMAGEFLLKFGGDTRQDIENNYTSYMNRIKDY